MKVDLSQLKMVMGGVKIEGLAQSLNLTLPAKRPDENCIICEHLEWDSPNLMMRGAVFECEIKQGKYKFILCKACVIGCQYFEEPYMQAQARICPYCFDDHSERRPCANADLIRQIDELRELVSVTKEATLDYIEDRGPGECHHVETMILHDILANGKKSESYEFYLNRIKGAKT